MLKYFFAELSKEPYSWFEGCREGSWDYTHPNGKVEKVKITEKTIDNFIRNFKENVRGLVLPGTSNPTVPIDYEHGKDIKYGKDAAGWIGDLEKRPKLMGGKTIQSLWIKPAEYTPDAQDAVKNGVKRFFSVTFNDWTNPETGKFYKDVLFGGALTNEPFVKGLTPITLTELKEELPKIEKEKSHMLEKLKRFLAAKDIKFAEDASDELVMTETHKYLTLMAEVKASDDEKIKELTEENKKLSDEFEAIEMAEAKLQEEAILKIAEKKVSPAKQKDPNSIFSKLMAEKRYADVKNYMDELPIAFKEETDSEDEDEEDDTELAEWDKIPGDKKDSMVKKSMAASKKNYAEAAKDVEEEYTKKLAGRKK